MKKKQKPKPIEAVPKNRKERLLLLIERGDLDINLYAKALKTRKDNLLRAFKGKNEINLLHYIMEAYYCLNGEVSLTWLITGSPPFKAPEKLFTYKRVDVQERLQELFKEENLSQMDIKDLGQFNRTTVQNAIASKSLNINHVIAIHLLTGVRLDFMLDGIGPKYIWEKDLGIMDML